uniref:Uncharacterized protein n=1 Tax=Anguilla anguilla TaxID=7936 RepID=A0A0E9TPD0_ANGAN
MQRKLCCQSVVSGWCQEANQIPKLRTSCSHKVPHIPPADHRKTIPCETKRKARGDHYMLGDQ